MLEQRPHELEEARELELDLVLDADRPDDGHPLCALGGVIEQGGLAHPRLTAKHERAATPTPGAIEQFVDARAVGFPTDEHGSKVALRSPPAKD